MILRCLEIAVKIALTVVLIFVLAVVGTIPFLRIASLIAGDSMGLEQILQLPVVESMMLLLSTLTNIVAVVIMYVLFERKRGLQMGWRQHRFGQAAYEGSLWGICFITVSFVAIRLLGGIRVVGVCFSADVLYSLLFAFLLFALVAVSEELLCRGYWQGLIRRYFGAVPAIGVSSVLFAALHLMNSNVLQSPIPFINIVLAGVLLGVCREITNGLWVPIGIYFTWNLFQGNIYGFAVSGLQTERSLLQIETVGHHLISGGHFGAEGSLVTAILLIIFTIAMIRRFENSPTAEM